MTDRVLAVQASDRPGDFDRFTALSFDCYGTLIDWETGIGEELAPWAASHGMTTSADDLVSAFAAVESGVQQASPTMPYPEVLAETLRGIGRRLGASVSEAEAAAFGASVPDWPAFPDSADALARLHARFKLIVLSNVDGRSFSASAARLGVTFDLVVTAEDVGAYKPSDRSFPALLARLPEAGVVPERLLHVAQSLYHDHGPAQAVGLPTVWIDRRHERAGAGATPEAPDGVAPRWRFTSMAAFADAAVGPSGSG